MINIHELTGRLKGALHYLKKNAGDLLADYREKRDSRTPEEVLMSLGHMSMMPEGFALLWGALAYEHTSSRVPAESIQNTTQETQVSSDSTHELSGNEPVNPQYTASPVVYRFKNEAFLDFLENSGLVPEVKRWDERPYGMNENFDEYRR